MIANFPLQTPEVELASPEERLHWLVKSICAGYWAALKKIALPYVCA
jgi:hypothetical protein